MADEPIKFTTQEMEDRNKALQIEERRTTDGVVTDPESASQQFAQIHSVAAEQTKHPGWVKLPEEELPQATYWPVIMALAITLFVFGVITTIIISIVGLILFAISLAGWIGDVRHESQEHHE